MGMSEKIKIVLLKRKMTITSLAKQLAMSQSNLSNKFNRDDFRESELRKIAEALDCDFEAGFILHDTGEKV